MNAGTSHPLPADTRRALTAAAARHATLDLLVLHGSRALGQATDASDWDFAFIADPGFESDALLADVVRAVGADRVDLVDLGRASGLLRYRAARDGAVVYERTAGTFDRFRLDAIRFWFDAEHVFRRGYEETLARLDR